MTAPALRAVSTAELREVLVPVYADRGIRSIDAHPFEYATSFALTVVTIELGEGGDEVLVMKDFDRRRMLPGARRHRAGRPVSSRREIDTYRHVLGPAHIGPRCPVTVADPVRSRFWLFTELVDGVELWQIGDPSVWSAVARWLGAMHARFADAHCELAAWLPTLDANGFAAWHRRAASVLATSTDPRAAALRGRLVRDGLARQLETRLASMPATFVHGELYPSNVMVERKGPGDVGVVPIDWETAALGPPMLDLAALVSGWDAPARTTLTRAYGPRFDPDALNWCSLHLALRWIALSPEWDPPAEHRQDWIGEALRAADEVAR